MNVSEYMKKHGLTDAALNEMALPYERGDYESEGGTVYSGSHIDAGSILGEAGTLSTQTPLKASAHPAHGRLAPKASA